MQRIPPKQRFSHHEKSRGLSPEKLKAAVEKIGGFSSAAEIVPLSGGFMNANYLVKEGAERAVLRFYSTDSITASREMRALQRAKEQGIKVPHFLASFTIENSPVSVLEFIDGVTLEDFILDRNSPPPSLFEEIGAELAKIHQISFSHCGFLNENFEPGTEFSEFGSFLREYIRKVLSNLESNRDRLNFSLNKRLRTLVEEKWHEVLAFEPRKELVHCDFNPKNLLVSRAGKLMAVLDWEFCLSGNGIEDLGNFFRFDYDYPSFARGSVAQGYRSVKPLAEGWERAAMLADIGSMCSFLERPENYPETFHTARTVIAATLEHFGY